MNTIGTSAPVSVTCANCKREIDGPPWNIRRSGNRDEVWCNDCVCERIQRRREKGWRFLYRGALRRACQECGARLRVDTDYRYLDRQSAEYCPPCLRDRRRRHSNESARAAKLAQADHLDAVAGKTPSCAECKRTIPVEEPLFNERGYWPGWRLGQGRRWRTAPLCSECAAKERRERDENNWERTVEQGTPGTYKGLFGTSTYLDPTAPGYDPLVERRRDGEGNVRDPDTCEICGREVVFGLEVRDRRTVVFCSEPCQAAAIRLSRRVPLREPQECAYEHCSEMFTPARAGARFHSPECRVAQWRLDRQRKPKRRARKT